MSPWETAFPVQRYTLQTSICILTVIYFSISLQSLMWKYSHNKKQSWVTAIQHSHPVNVTQSVNLPIDHDYWFCFPGLNNSFSFVAVLMIRQKRISKVLQLLLDWSLEIALSPRQSFPQLSLSELSNLSDYGGSLDCAALSVINLIGSTSRL